MNIHNYTSASSATSGSTSFNSSKDSRDGMIPPTFSLFYNNPYLKNVQASPIPPQDPITPPAILTPSLVLPPSLLFDPRYFFVPEELLPPKKQIHPPSFSSTTLSNSSRKQETFRTYTATNGYTGNHPLCERCTLHHIGPCTVKCQTCNKIGHLTKNCRNKGPSDY
ncbi:retrovirus-related pol polyprotein from transposon TNT 1-94 [Tanacetum coccineum]